MAEQDRAPGLTEVYSQSDAANAWIEVEKFISGQLGHQAGESDDISEPLHVLAKFIATPRFDESYGTFVHNLKESIAARDSKIGRLQRELAANGGVIEAARELVRTPYEDFERPDSDPKSGRHALVKLARALEIAKREAAQAMTRDLTVEADAE